MAGKSTAKDMDRLFLSRIRLGIMSALADGESRDFTYLKTLLECSDGNLGAHLLKLEQSKMVVSKKSFVNRKPNTSYLITQKGRKAFANYVEELASLLGLPNNE